MKITKSKIGYSLSIMSIFLALNTTAQKAEFGIRAMPTFSSIQVNNSTGGVIAGQATIGYGIGAMLAFNFTNQFAIEVDGIYSTINQKYREQDMERKIQLKYLNIPMLISLNTNKLSPVNLNLVVGPQIGISAGTSFTTSGTDTTNAIPVLAVKKGDLGLAYGAGLDFGLNPTQTFRLAFGFRGTMGLLDISDDSRTTVTNSYYLLDRTRIKTYSGYIGFSVLF